MTTVTVPDRRARLARAAVAAVFLTNGAVFANVVPRYPMLKEQLGLSNAELGAAVAAMPLGALAAGLLATAAIRLLGSARVAALAIVLLALTTVLIAFSPNGFTVGVVLFAVGALDSLIDVAQNAHGLRVQRIYRRSIVNSFHGLWSIGAVLGGLMGSAAAGLALPLELHLGISAALFSLVALVAYRFMLPGHDDTERTEPPPAQGKPTWPALRMLTILGLLAICGALIEDAGASWGAIYLNGTLHASPALAGLAFVALQTAMTIGRLTGDRLVDRLGQRTVTRAGGALAALGMGLALAFPTTATTLAGFALAGLGTATLVPAAMHTADELRGLAPGLGLTVVSWLLRVGFLVSPPLVGLVADLAGLRIGLLSVVVAGVATVLLGRVLLNRA